VGCRAITPELVSLASRLEGKPFHLVASFCQKGTREDTTAYIKGQGLAADTPNMTVTYQGRHPQVKGNGSVPYYIVFDHTGKMVQHHMCGNYHGGDGLKMIEWVDDLLAKAPELWLGEEEFTAHTRLAERIAAKKHLDKAVLELEALREAASDDELERLHAAMVRYRDRGLAGADALVASRPSAAVPALTALSTELGNSELGAPVRERLAEVDSSDELKRAIALEKDFLKQRKRIEKAKPCKSCKRNGSKQHKIGCADCEESNTKTISSMRKKLDALLEAAEGLPFRATIEALRNSLGE